MRSADRECVPSGGGMSMGRLWKVILIERDGTECAGVSSTHEKPGGRMEQREGRASTKEMDVVELYTYCSSERLILCCFACRSEVHCEIIITVLLHQAVQV